MNNIPPYLPPQGPHGPRGGFNPDTGQRPPLPRREPEGDISLKQFRKWLIIIIVATAVLIGGAILFYYYEEALPETKATGTMLDLGEDIPSVEIEMDPTLEFDAQRRELDRKQDELMHRADLAEGEQILQEAYINSISEEPAEDSSQTQDDPIDYYEIP